MATTLQAEAKAEPLRALCHSACAALIKPPTTPSHPQVHGDGCLTFALLPGAGGAYDECAEPPIAALTLRVAGGGGGSGGGGVAGGGGGGGEAGGGAAAGGERASEQAACAEILTCAVQHKWKGRGAGSLLVTWALQQAAARRIPHALVAASPDAVGFWRRLGFATPPPQVPFSSISRLSATFEGSIILHASPAALLLTAAAAANTASAVAASTSAPAPSTQSAAGEAAVTAAVQRLISAPQGHGVAEGGGRNKRQRR